MMTEREQFVVTTLRRMVDLGQPALGEAFNLGYGIALASAIRLIEGEAANEAAEDAQAERWGAAA